MKSKSTLAPVVQLPADPKTAAVQYLQGLEQRRRDVADVRDILDDDVDQAATDLDARIKDLALGQMVAT